MCAVTLGLVPPFPRGAIAGLILGGGGTSLSHVDGSVMVITILKGLSTGVTFYMFGKCCVLTCSLLPKEVGKNTLCCVFRILVSLPLSQPIPWV